MLLAASLAMLSACAGSPAKPAPALADPVIATRIERVRVCPPELDAPLPPRPDAASRAALPR